MTIFHPLTHSWAVGQRIHELARRFPFRMPLKPLSVPGRPRLEMRWHLDANGRLICTWLRVAGATPVRLSDEDAKPPSWHTLGVVPPLPVRVACGVAA
jgi:hypothetical protein